MPLRARFTKKNSEDLTIGNPRMPFTKIEDRVRTRREETMTAGFQKNKNENEKERQNTRSTNN